MGEKDRKLFLSTLIVAGLTVSGCQAVGGVFKAAGEALSPNDVKALTTPTRVTVSRAPTPGPTDVPFIRVAAIKTDPDLAGSPVHIGNEIVVRVDDHTVPNAAAVLVIAATAAGLFYLSSREQT